MNARTSSGVQFWLPLCVLAVWLIWGSTYIAIAITLETMPPFGMAGLRLTMAGLFMLALSRLRGLRLPTGAEWRSCAIIGVLMFVGGNGSVVFAEQTVSSGLVAILVGAMPLWTALIGLAYGVRPAGRQWAGIALGMAGIAVLNARGELSANPVAAVGLALGSGAWALGTVQGHRWPMPPGTMATAAQLLSGGLALALLSAGTGERIDLGNISLHSWLAFAYLLVFGSIVAFTAYGYLLKHASLPVATSYAYVNPVVAVFLGAWIGGERIGTEGLSGLALIVLAVLLVTAPTAKPVP